MVIDDAPILKTLFTNSRIFQLPISLEMGKPTLMTCADFVFILRTIP